MARIRSIHPALFTDETFAVLSMSARVLLVGLWTEADDQGVFEWKPITLKMRLMPVDNVSVPDLLQELEAHNVIKSFTQDERQFGAIRNFCKYQKPKTPKYRDISSETIRNYVASTYPTSEKQKAQPSPFPQKVETPPQREEGGDKKEEVKKEISPPVAKATRGVDEKFEEFWKERPRRAGDDPRKPAEKKFKALVKTGVDADVIISGAKLATIAAKEQGKYGTQYVPQTVKWLNDQRFIDYAAAAFNDDATEEPQINWDDQVARFKRGFQWSAKWCGPEPGMAGCKVPASILIKYGYGLPDQAVSTPQLRSMGH
jgi:hypothetical protein